MEDLAKKLERRFRESLHRGKKRTDHEIVLVEYARKKKHSST